MADKPIPFSGPMIRALLEGRKTQTRRVLKPHGTQRNWLSMEALTRSPSCYTCRVNGSLGVQMRHPLAGQNGNDQKSPLTWIKLPIQTGDRLWVKESHYAHGHWELTGELTRTGKPERRFVRVQETPVLFELNSGLIRPNTLLNVTGWYARPGMFMFKSDSRLTLTVTDVRVQRLQEISAEDCEREGIKISDGALMRDGYMLANRKDFQHLWNSINGPDAWDQNPWVAAYSFNVHHCNIDQMGATA